jgi:hypothetical protein
MISIILTVQGVLVLFLWARQRELSSRIRALEAKSFRAKHETVGHRS